MSEPARPCVTACERDGDAFVLRQYRGLKAEAPLPAVGITVPLAELYARVDIAAAAAEEVEADPDAD